MASKKSKKTLKDMKPRKSAAQKVKGGGVSPPAINVLGEVREMVQKIRPN